jgi:hypothetical protein
LRLTVTTAEPVHDPTDPTTVYVVVAPGVATTAGPLVVFKVAPGLQVYVLAPLTDKLAEDPKQTPVEVGVTVRVGGKLPAGRVILVVVLHPVTLFIIVAVYTPPTFAEMVWLFIPLVIPGPVQVYVTPLGDAVITAEP